MIFSLPDIPELSPNRLAMPYVEELIKDHQKFKVAVHERDGVHIIDCGVNVRGSWEAGILFATISMGGLGQVDTRWADFNGFRWPSVQVMTDHPLRACMLSQFAGWPIYTRGFSALGSGPGRAVADFENIFTELGCVDQSEIAILCLESEKLPTKEAIRNILEKCHCKPENLFILVAPTTSSVGSIQIAARALETGLYKLKSLSYDISTIRSGWGVCPLPPVAPDRITALGRTNDAILYGATVYYNVEDNDENLAAMIHQLPSSFSKEFGRSFIEISKNNEDFYDIDPLLFSPAEVWLTNLKSGRTFHAGRIRPDILVASFGTIND